MKTIDLTITELNTILITLNESYFRIVKELDKTTLGDIERKILELNKLTIANLIENLDKTK